jgi:hypothetical protein
MSSKKKQERLEELNQHLLEARRIVSEIDEMPTIKYRGVDAADLKLDARMEAILRYIGNGCPNIYYADDWFRRLINPPEYTMTERIDEMIGAVEMTRIQANIGEIAPELASKLTE